MTTRFYLLLMAVILLLQGIQAQNYREDLHGPLFYEANQGTQFHIIKLDTGLQGGFKETLSEEFKLAPSKFFFKKNTVKKYPGKDFKVVEISFPDYSLKKKKRKKDTASHYETPSYYINATDNGRVFWMRLDDFDELVSNKLIREYHRRRYPSFAYGGNLSIPFKMRPETGDQYMKITPEFTLGGYAGCKFRLAHHSDFSITVPVVTLGVTTIGINDNNTVVENQALAQKTPDALLLGRTFSIGLVLEYNNFQLGVITGWDKASGEVGRKWIYNDKAWYSFSIGFSFLNAQ